MKIQRKRSNKIMASVSGKIPYELVSTLTVLRDYADVDDAYVSDEHKKLVDIADSIYNADIDPESMYDEYKSLYKKYGKSYFDKVLKDIRAIDSQISSSNVRDLADEYEGRVAEFGGEVESACGKKSIESARRTVKANYSNMRLEFQSFLSRVDKEVSDALYQYGDALWDVKGTMNSGGDGSYWFELNLWCENEEAGTVNIEVENGTYHTSTAAYVVSVPDSDEIQAEGNSFADVYDTCVGELIRLAEDYENFVR